MSARTEAELARKEDFVGRSLAGPSTGGTDAGVELPRPRAGLMSSGDSWLRLWGGRPSCLLGPDSAEGGVDTEGAAAPPVDV